MDSSQFLNVGVDLVENPGNEKYHAISREALKRGNEIGRAKFGKDGWEKKKSDSEEKLRIWTLPVSFGGSLVIEVTPYQWSDLQAHKQVQPDTTYDETDERRYFTNAIALTANGLIKTSDEQLIFHFKKGGAAEGSIHTFGGYASRQDIENGGVEETILRELGEKEEVGLARGEMELRGLFGTPKGMPSILWGFGTGAVYGVVETGLSSEEIQKRMYEKSAGESLWKKLYTIPIAEVRNLLDRENIHPQTKLVLPTICEICETYY